MVSFSDCCSFILSKLPRAELPFIPAFILGTIFSLLLLFYLYKKHENKSGWNAFKNMVVDLFVSVPKEDHGEFMQCANKNCVRCKKSEALKVSIIDKWNTLPITHDISIYRRIKKATELLHQSISQKTPIGGVSKSNQRPTIFYMDLPASPNWTERDALSVERELLKLNYGVIRKEFEAVFKFFQKGKTEGWKLNHIPSGHWCIFPLIDQGVVNQENCLKCPNTSSLLMNLPSLMRDCVFGNASFSLLYPDSHIESHFGPTNLRLRCHLGLTIPDDCWLEVDGTQLRWEEGEALVFDDSYEHSTYYGPNKNYSQPRAVLLLDFWHPGVSLNEKEVFLKILNPLT